MIRFLTRLFQNSKKIISNFRVAISHIKNLYLLAKLLINRDFKFFTFLAHSQIAQLFLLILLKYHHFGYDNHIQILIHLYQSDLS